MRDPVERAVRDALDAAGIHYRPGYQTKELDFYLPDADVSIECKQFHSERIADQMSRHPNVIAIQGIGAATAFARMLKFQRQNKDTKT